MEEVKGILLQGFIQNMRHYLSLINEQTEWKHGNKIMHEKP